MAEYFIEDFEIYLKDDKDLDCYYHDCYDISTFFDIAIQPIIDLTEFNWRQYLYDNHKSPTRLELIKDLYSVVELEPHEKVDAMGQAIDAYVDRERDK